MSAVFNSWQSVAPWDTPLNDWQDVAPCCAPATIETFTMEALPIVTVNVVPPLSQAALGDLFFLIVNGRTFTPVDPAAPFTLAGATITWTSALYALNPGDAVIAVYTFARPL